MDLLLNCELIMKLCAFFHRHAEYRILILGLFQTYIKGNSYLPVIEIVS